MQDRLKQFIDYHGLSVNAFATKINIPEATIRRFLALKNGITADTLLKISNTYSDLNLDWLITGRGEMLCNTAQIGTFPASPAALSANISNSTAVGVNVSGNGNTITNNNPLLPILESLSSTIASLTATNSDLASQNSRLLDRLDCLSASPETPL